MKFLLSAAIILMVAAAPKSCNQKSAAACYKGKLEIKGICSNYTIRLLEGNIDPVQASWTDETTGKAYANVFKLANPCAFPNTINEGDEFYFTIDTAKQENCSVCMAYYPTPPKVLAIKVLSAKCD